ncbi:winged helix-turn-helix transcriptional regulator [Pseudonocardia lacus]|uniref:winged helix-turn-helix transcriptional regulator n=1 Tax=Pseudonocardia lacus TaxID=2835865 RepID=UPI0027E3A8DA|nr:helix-turn-helix domain-containing protein [Pseudonocardia lacus]
MRSYHDPCGVARALDVVGERWALLVVRELLLGPKRFTDLAAGLPGLSQNVLSQRLRDLERAGIVTRARLGPPAGTRAYRLTERGAELEPVLLALARWGSRVPLPGSDAELGVDALALALRTTFDPDAADGLRLTATLRLGDDALRATVHDGRFALARGEAEDPDAVLSGEPGALRAVVFGGRPPRDAGLRIDGDRPAALHLLHCFPRPTPVENEVTAGMDRSNPR